MKITLAFRIAVCNTLLGACEQTVGEQEHRQVRVRSRPRAHSRLPPAVRSTALIRGGKATKLPVAGGNKKGATSAGEGGNED